MNQRLLETCTQLPENVQKKVDRQGGMQIVDVLNPDSFQMHPEIVDPENAQFHVLEKRSVSTQNVTVIYAKEESGISLRENQCREFCKLNNVDYSCLSWDNLGEIAGFHSLIIDTLTSQIFLDTFPMGSGDLPEALVEQSTKIKENVIVTCHKSPLPNFNLLNELTDNVDLAMLAVHSNTQLDQNLAFCIDGIDAVANIRDVKFTQFDVSSVKLMTPVQLCIKSDLLKIIKLPCFMRHTIMKGQHVRFWHRDLFSGLSKVCRTKFFLSH